MEEAQQGKKMSYWTCKTEGGVVTASYLNPPMNYFCAEGAGELGELIEAWRNPAIKAVVLVGGIDGKFITHYSVEELLSYAEDREGLRKAGTVLTAGYHAVGRWRHSHARLRFPTLRAAPRLAGATEQSQ